jgi:hypothetical protein
MPRKAKSTNVKKTIKLEETETAKPTKYLPTIKIGEPKLGVDPELVTRVGLGSLEVIDNGRTTYTP